jgi:hypothetical protein
VPVIGVLIAAVFLGALLYFGFILPAIGVASEHRQDKQPFTNHHDDEVNS